MKNKMFLISALVIIALTSGVELFAQDNQPDGKIPKLSLGGGPFFANDFAGGGYADFAFLIFNKNAWDIRNHFVFRGGGLSADGGIISLSEKISVGGLIQNKFRSYGYFEGGIGLLANTSKSFFETPLTGTFGGGGGTEIFLVKSFCIFFEAGALMYITDGDWLGGGMFQIGWKGYF
jgi:hypothetical protein